MVIWSGLDDVLSESSAPKCEDYYVWVLGLLFPCCVWAFSLDTSMPTRLFCAICLICLFVHFSASSVLLLNCLGHSRYFTLSIFSWHVLFWGVVAYFLHSWLFLGASVQLWDFPVNAQRCRNSLGGRGMIWSILVCSRLIPGPALDAEPGDGLLLTTWVCGHLPGHFSQVGSGWWFQARQSFPEEIRAWS